MLIEQSRSMMCLNLVDVKLKSLLEVTKIKWKQGFQHTAKIPVYLLK